MEKLVVVRWTVPALKDFSQAIEFIVADSAKGASIFAETIDQSIEWIRLHPALGRPGTVAGTREWIFSGLPYIIPYRVKGGVVEILRIYHTSRLRPSKGSTAR